MITRRKLFGKQFLSDNLKEAITWVLVASFVGSQFRFVPEAQAASPGTTTVSAGSAPPPAVTTVENFQADLFTGRATTSLSMPVPPGRKGVEPALGVGYVSGSQNGWLGAGWNLSMGFIERSTRLGVPTYNDSTDRFTFAMQGINSDLVKIGDGTYRAEVEGAFMKVVNLGAAGWEVRDQSGTRYLFGSSASSQLSSSGKVFRWCLDKVIDVNGNTMTYSYVAYGNQPYPSQIDYTGHTNGLAAANRVTFTWEDRPDIVRHMRYGWEVQSPKRLSKVETWATVKGTLSLAARYQFGYGVSARTGRSLLTSFTKYGSDGVTSLPPMTFSYQSADAPQYSVNLKQGAGSQIAWNVRAAGADMGHDNFGCVDPYSGLPWTDPVVVSNAHNFGGVSVSVGSRGQISFNGGQDNFVHAWTAVYVSQQKNITLTPAGNWDVCCLYLQDTGAPYWVPMGTITLKAGWTIVHLVGYHQHDSFSGGLATALADQVDLMSPRIVTEPQMAGDVDGNGINDLVNFKNGTWNVSLASSAGTMEPPKSWLSGFGDSGYVPLIGDWNADGRTDVALYSNGVWRFAVSSGSNFTANGLSSATFGAGQPVAGDFNGDGLVDLGSYKDGQWKIALGNGSTFSAASAFDTYMAEGAPVLAASDVRWTVRMWARDCAHENQGCFYPYGGTMCGGASWDTAIVGQSTVNVGGGQAVVGSDGSLMCYAGQDRFFWANVAVYVTAGKYVSLGNNSGWDVACLYHEPRGGSVSPVSVGSLGSVWLPQGWSKIHLTGYNQNQGISAGVYANVRGQVDIMAPDYIQENTSSSQYLTGDFNGDGLTDVAVIKNQQAYVALSTGSQFVRVGPWSIPFGDKDYTTADYNGDGLTDMAWYDRSNGKVKVTYSTGNGLGAVTELPLTFSLRLAHDQVQVGEWNGDGLPDLCIMDNISGDIEMGYSSGTAPDLLTRINNELGGFNTISYQPSTRLNNTFLPMVMPVVTESASSDGRGNTYRKTYSYGNGLYDAPTREFRGFGHVEVRNAENTATVTDFHQDYQRKGRIYQSTVYDVLGNLWTKTENSWISSEAYPASGSYFTRLIKMDGYTYGGDTTYKQMQIQYQYDGYGNITNVYELGDLALPGDDRTTARSFAINTNQWILNKPVLVQQYDALRNLIAQERYLYDGSSTVGALPQRGNATRAEKWLNVPSARWVGVVSTYDAYGNAVTVMDPRGNSITNAYDTVAYTYLVSVKNPLGHARSMTFDPRFGGLVSSVNENGVTDFRQYDSLNRVVARGYMDPSTGVSNVFESVAYNHLSFPQSVISTAYLSTNKLNPLVSYQFIDGLGRTIQKRTPAEEPGKQIVSGTVEFDALGRASKAWVSYYETASTTFNSNRPSQLLPSIYEYDVLSRLVNMTNPDGTSSQVQYDDWMTTGIDANGKLTRILSDAYKRTVSVEEQSSGQSFITKYEYDALDQTTLIRDAQGNELRVEYDSLGRRTLMNDPNLGIWTYRYDDGGNIVSYQDARGVSTTNSYDVLGRLTRRESTPPAGSGIAYAGPVTFSYDAGAYGKGKQTGISDPASTASMQYDFKDRLISDTKTVDGVAYTITRTYDFQDRLIGATYPNSDSVSYTFNNQGGVETVNYRRSAGEAIALITDMTYNAQGQVTRIVYGNGTSTDYSRNPQTLRPERTVTYGPGGAAIQDLNYQFDPKGNLTQLTDAARSTTQTFGYDDLSRLTSASGPYGSLSYAYDAIGNLTSKEGLSMTYGAGPAGPHAVTARSDGMVLSYDANGNMTVKDSPARGLRQELSYDVLNRLVRVTNSVSSASSSVSLQAGWNLVSFPQAGAGLAITNALPVFKTKCAQLSVPTNGLFKSFANNPSFDQFSTVKASEGYWLHVTNATGAVISWTNATALSPQSLKTGWCLLPGPSKSMLVGAWLNNLQAGTDYGTVKGYVSNAFAQVTTVEPGRAYMVQMLRAATWTPPGQPVNGESRFVYDGQGVRIKKVTAAGTNTYLGAAFEVKPNGDRVAYVFAGSRRIAAVYPGTNWYVYHPDHLGSPNLVTDRSGQVVERSEFTPFGSMSYHTGTLDASQKFTGQIFDAETGLYYFNARYYDPELGRFTSPDTIQQDPTDPQTLNRYSYARNNPLVMADPSGHLLFLLLGSMALGAFMGAATSALMAAIMGGDVGAAAWRGAMAGAITGPFNLLGSALFTGTTIWDFLGTALVSAVGSAAGAAAVASISGEDVGKSALNAFTTSMYVSAGSFAVGKISGWSSADHEAKLEVDSSKHPDGRLPAGGSARIRVGGQSESSADAVTRMKQGNFDARFYNPTRGGFLDTVESAQSLIFGPGVFARSLGKQLDALAAQNTTVYLFTHSQGTIMGGQALGLMRNKHDNWTIKYSRPAMFAPTAYANAWDGGVSVVQGGFAAHPLDIVSALGNPLFMPTAILYLPVYIFGGSKFGAEAVHCGAAAYQ